MTVTIIIVSEFENQACFGVECFQVSRMYYQLYIDMTNALGATSQLQVKALALVHITKIVMKGSAHIRLYKEVEKKGMDCLLS